ncbi:hypothetical protein [Streptomyces sp. CA-111067]|uniref:hypothetical protein n=1 Tax=Streptomyces sp. CA-111067 TaxID=3240046 RepID=UPI003D98C983
MTMLTRKKTVYPLPQRTALTLRWGLRLSLLGCALSLIGLVAVAAGWQNSGLRIVQAALLLAVLAGSAAGLLAARRRRRSAMTPAAPEGPSVVQEWNGPQ